MSDWINIDAVDNFKHGHGRVVDLGELQIAIFNVNGEYYAVEDSCSHDHSPILGCPSGAETVLDGEEIICPRHGSRFCLKTGTALTPPAYEALAVFPVRIVDGVVQTRDNRSD